MKKDAYYFSHDSNAQDDPKMMILIDQLGMEGYGIFWALIEKLRAEANYKLPLVVTGSLARRWGTSKEKVDTVVKNYGLFMIEDELFFSLRLLRSMEEKSAKARLSANYRWGNANALQPHTEGSTDGMQNDAIKGKESKGKKKGNSPKESTNPTDAAGALAPVYSEKEKSEFDLFNKYILQHAANVSKMKEPFTIAQYVEVKNKYNRELVKDILKEMHNYAPLLKKNISSYLTLCSWIRRREPNGAIIKTLHTAQQKELLPARLKPLS
jgi:hypothetical protein